MTRSIRSFSLRWIVHDKLGKLTGVNSTKTLIPGQSKIKQHPWRLRSPKTLHHARTAVFRQRFNRQWNRFVSRVRGSSLPTKLPFISRRQTGKNQTLDLRNGTARMECRVRPSSLFAGQQADGLQSHSGPLVNKSLDERVAAMANCELLEKCGFFNNYKGNTEVVKQGWIRLYCESLEKSERCERKKIRRETGKPPADNMAPTGKML